MKLDEYKKLYKNLNINEVDMTIMIDVLHHYNYFISHIEGMWYDVVSHSYCIAGRKGKQCFSFQFPIFLLNYMRRYKNG